MNKRDLKADLEICDKATPGPWRAGGSFVITFHDEWICEVVGEYSMGCEDNMRFVAQAREGWPHAIERAIKAETLVRELVGVIDDLLRQINECGLDNEMWEVYERAKKVLGDE